MSRVYSHQCGYTLTDVQAMHDKMRAVFKVLPGGGLDPAAGKAKYVQSTARDIKPWTTSSMLTLTDRTN